MKIYTNKNGRQVWKIERIDFEYLVQKISENPDGYTEIEYRVNFLSEHIFPVPQYIYVYNAATGRFSHIQYLPAEIIPDFIYPYLKWDNEIFRRHIQNKQGIYIEYVYTDWYDGHDPYVQFVPASLEDIVSQGERKRKYTNDRKYFSIIYRIN